MMIVWYTATSKASIRSTKYNLMNLYIYEKCGDPLLRGMMICSDYNRTSRSAQKSSDTLKILLKVSPFTFFVDAHHHHCMTMTTISKHIQWMDIDSEIVNRMVMPNWRKVITPCDYGRPRVAHELVRKCMNYWNWFS